MEERVNIAANPTADLLPKLKKLLQDCENSLRYSAAGNLQREYIRHPRVPLVNLIWSGVSDSAVASIADVFDSVWVPGIARDETYALVRAEGSPEYISASVRELAVQLKMGDIIDDVTTVYVANYFNILSPEFEKDLDTAGAFLRCMDNSILNSPYILNFVVCDDPLLENTEKVKARISAAQKEFRQRDNNIGIFLSNHLEDGSILRKSQFEENYRVAADIALLTCTAADSEYKEPGNIIGWLTQNRDRGFTAAFLRMQKPSYDIARVTLKRIIERRMEFARDNRSERENSQAHLTANQFWDAMNISPTSIPSIDRAFEKYIRPLLPNERSLEYLPNWKKASKSYNFDEADAATEGFLRLFVRERFVLTASNPEFVDMQNICDSFIRELSRYYDYEFASRYFANCADYIDLIKLPATQGIYAGAISRARSAFYDMLKPVLKKAMKDYAKMAENFSLSLTSISNTLEKAPLPTEAGVTPADEFYYSRADRYLAGMGDNINYTLMPGVDSDSLIEGLRESFDKVRGADPDLYQASLEEELAARVILGVKAMAAKIAVQLDSSDLETKMRIRATHYGDKQAYYIYNGDAIFGKSLNVSNGKFVTSCRDSAARLILTSFDAVDDLI